MQPHTNTTQLILRRRRRLPFDKRSAAAARNNEIMQKGFCVKRDAVQFLVSFRKCHNFNNMT